MGSFRSASPLAPVLRGSTVALCSALVLCSASCERSDGNEKASSGHISGALASAQQPALTWSPGHYVYALEQSATTGTAVGVAMVHYEMSGKLEVDVRNPAAGTAELALYIRGASFRGIQPEAEPQYLAMGKELERPFLFTLKNGRISAESHSTGLSPFAVGIQRSLAAALQFTAPDRAAPNPSAANGGTWRGQEVDATGEFSVEYSRRDDGITWTRRKLEYAAPEATATPSAALDSAPKLHPLVPESTCTLSVTKGQLTKLESRERLELPLGRGMTYGGTIELRMVLESRSQALLVNWEDAVARSVAIQPGKSHVAPGKVDSLDTTRGEGRNFEELLVILEATAQDTQALKDLVGSVQGTANPNASDQAAREARMRERGKDFSATVAVLRSTPGSMAKAKAAISRGSPASPILLDALASVGTPEAQAMLVSFVEQTSIALELRARAAAALMQVERPTADAVASLTGLTKDPRLSVHALYGLGTMSRKLRVAGDEAAALAIANTLVAELRAARSSAARSHVLRAIANSGHDRAFTVVRPYLTSESIKERTAAVDAIRLMSLPEVDELLLKVMDSETASVVRGAAVEALEVRRSSKALTDALSRAARSDKDSSVRLRAVNVLASWLPAHPEVRGVLEALAETESNPRVREAAIGAVAKR